MKEYRGVRTPKGCVVTVADGGGKKKLPIRHDVRRHSEEFEWGYAGSGPAQLALALLCDVLGDAERAQETYQRFKFQVIARLAGDEWTLAEDRVMEIVACLELGYPVS